MTHPLHKLCLVGVFLAIAPALFAQSASASRAARSGNEAYDEGDHKKALKHYERALEKGMKDPRLRFNKGDALYQLDKYADAARTFKNIARESEKSPLKAKAYHNLGNAQLRAGKLDKSIEAYKNALRIDPRDEETRYNLALAKRLKKKKRKKKKRNKKQRKKKQKRNQKKKKGNKKKRKGKKGNKRKKKS
ncbi:MAG: tetratricopeptide repeat protein, partial [Flavobacteriales bacterium]